MFKVAVNFIVIFYNSMKLKLILKLNIFEEIFIVFYVYIFFIYINYSKKLLQFGAIKEEKLFLNIKVIYYLVIIY